MKNFKYWLTVAAIGYVLLASWMWWSTTQKMLDCCDGKLVESVLTFFST